MATLFAFIKVGFFDGARNTVGFLVGALIAATLFAFIKVGFLDGAFNTVGFLVGTLTASRLFAFIKVGFFDGALKTPLGFFVGAFARVVVTDGFLTIFAFIGTIVGFLVQT